MKVIITIDACLSIFLFHFFFYFSFIKQSNAESLVDDNVTITFVNLQQDRVALLLQCICISNGTVVLNTHTDAHNGIGNVM